MKSLQDIFGNIDIDAFWQEAYRVEARRPYTKWLPADIFSLRYSRDGQVVRTFREIAEITGLSYQRLQYIHDMAIIKMRHPSKRENYEL